MERGCAPTGRAEGQEKAAARVRSGRIEGLRLAFPANVRVPFGTTLEASNSVAGTPVRLLGYRRGVSATPIR